MSKAEFVRDMVRTNPLLIPHTLSNPDFNNKMTHAIMYDLLPFKLGIEIECGGNLSRSLFQNTIQSSSDMSWKRLMMMTKNHYNVDSFSVDMGMGENMYCEHRIRIVGYKHLLGLYRILEDMKKYCKINISGGIHIHVDFSDFYGDNYIQRKIDSNQDLLRKRKFYTNVGSRKNRIAEEFEKYLDETVEFFQYTGKYSPKKVTLYKEGVISLRDETVEFRCGDCTFDYEKVVSQLIFVSQICKKVKKCFGKHY